MSVYFFYDESEPIPFKYLTPTRTVGQLPPPYESTMTPSSYLEFAVDDLKDESTRGAVNAFSNAKRAFHLSVDNLLHQYGLFKYYKRSNFPSKLKVLDELGILPIKVMGNLNFERNILEHQYDTPELKRVAEAVDIVKLILLATEKILENVPHEFVIGWKNPSKHLIMQLEPIQGVINFFSLKAKGKYRKSHGIFHFSGNLRSILDGSLEPGIQISKKPWKSIKLVKSEQNEWKPIVREIVNIQRRQRPEKTHIDEQGFVTMPITFPLPALENMSWAELIDKFIKQKMSENVDLETDN